MELFSWNLLEYIFSLIECALFFYFLSMILRKRFNSAANTLLVVLYFIINSFLSKNLPFSNGKLMVIVLISMLFAIVIYRGSVKSKMILTLVFFMLLVLCDVLTANILGIIMKLNIQEVIFTEEWFRVFLFCLSKMVLLFILKFVHHFIGHDKLHIPLKYWYMMMSIFIISLIILMVIGEIGVSTPYYSHKPVYFVVTCSGILVINVFVQYIFIQLSRYYEKEQTYNIIKVRNESMEKYYLDREQVYKETRKLGHDFKNHMFCIKALIDSNKIEEAKKYIEEVNEIASINSNLIRSGNDIVDAILNQKSEQASKLGINMDLAAAVPKEIDIKPMDLCAILANVIDNALEAAMKINEGNERKVKVKINPYKDYLLILVSNTSNVNPLLAPHKFKTTKEDSKNHGLGTKIIKSIVEKYSGSVEYDYESNVFTVKILLKI